MGSVLGGVPSPADRLALTDAPSPNPRRPKEMGSIGFVCFPCAVYLFAQPKMESSIVALSLALDGWLEDGNAFPGRKVESGRWLADARGVYHA